MRAYEAFSIEVLNRMKEMSMGCKRLDGMASTLLLVLSVALLLALFTYAAYAGK